MVAEYSSPGECFVFEACNLELHGYRRENYGCAGIEYERLDNRQAILHFREPDSGDMATQQTLLVFDSPTSVHYYDIVCVTAGNGSRIVTIYPMEGSVYESVRTKKQGYILVMIQPAIAWGSNSPINHENTLFSLILLYPHHLGAAFALSRTNSLQRLTDSDNMTP